jgi:hypothetical protein
VERRVWIVLLKPRPRGLEGIGRDRRAVGEVGVSLVTANPESAFGKAPAPHWLARFIDSDLSLRPAVLVELDEPLVDPVERVLLGRIGP